MRKKATPTSDSDKLEPAVWDDPLYVYEDKDSWNESLLRCYSKKKTPKDLSKCHFVQTPDSAEERGVKNKAAQTALKYVMSLYDHSQKEGKQLPPRDIYFARANLFFCCLRTFHPLTLHMKVTGFINHYKTFCIFSCPLNKAAESWRTYHGLHFLNEGGDFHINCTCGNVLTGPAIDYHAKNGNDEYSFHKGIKVYYKECFKSLQNVANKYVKETGEGCYKISTCLPKLPPGQSYLNISGFESNATGAEDDHGVVPDYDGTSEDDDDGSMSSASFEIIKDVDLSVDLFRKKKQQIVVCTNNANKSVTPPADAGNIDSQLIPKKKPDDNPKKCDDNKGKKSSNEKPQCNPPKYTRHSSLIDKKPCQNPQIPTRGNNCFERRICPTTQCTSRQLPCVATDL